MIILWKASAFDWWDLAIDNGWLIQQEYQLNVHLSEATNRRFSSKWVLLKISQISFENF